jgi:hypothetical protein
LNRDAIPLGTGRYVSSPSRHGRRTEPTLVVEEANLTVRSEVRENRERAEKEVLMRFGIGAVAVILALVGAAVAEAPAASQAVVASATGSGHMVRPDGTFRSFSFSARRYGDGTSTGQLELNSRSFDVVVHIKVDCLRVVGNVAHMSGRITRINNPDEGEVGELNRVEVRDNGEGANAPPDQVSTIPANPDDADPTSCLDPPTNPTIRTVQRGNVQVRD